MLTKTKTSATALRTIIAANMVVLKCWTDVVFVSNPANSGNSVVVVAFSTASVVSFKNEVVDGGRVVVRIVVGTEVVGPVVLLFALFGNNAGPVAGAAVDDKSDNSTPAVVVSILLNTTNFEIITQKCNVINERTGKAEKPKKKEQHVFIRVSNPGRQH